MRKTIQNQTETRSYDAFQRMTSMTMPCADGPRIGAFFLVPDTAYALTRPMPWRRGRVDVVMAS